MASFFEALLLTGVPVDVRVSSAGRYLSFATRDDVSAVAQKSKL